MDVFSCPLLLYAPGVTERDQIRSIVSAVAPKPVNLLISSKLGWRVADVAEMGIRRISVGSSLARSAWTGFLCAAQHMAEHGSFAGFDGIVPFGDLNAFFRSDWAHRRGEAQ